MRSGGCDRSASIHHDAVVAGVRDALQHRLRQVGPLPAAHLDAQRQPSGEPPRNIESVVVGVVVDEEQLPREAAAGQGPGHALGQRLEVGGLSQRRHHDRHRRVILGQGKQPPVVRSQRRVVTAPLIPSPRA